MKKLFNNVLFIILTVMCFVYLFTQFKAVTSSYDETENVISLTNGTGLGAIAIILIIPAFVFTIIAFSTGKQTMIFLRNIFSLFASAFTIGADIVALFYALSFVVPIILLIASLTLFVFSLIEIVSAIKKEKAEIVA